MGWDSRIVSPVVQPRFKPSTSGIQTRDIAGTPLSSVLVLWWLLWVMNLQVRNRNFFILRMQCCTEGRLLYHGVGSLTTYVLRHLG